MHAIEPQHQKRRWWWGVLLIGFASLAGCASPPPTTPPGYAAYGATPNPALAATFQSDQYLRDANATGTARAVQFAIDVQNVQATAEQATRAAFHLQATLDAQATRIEFERQAQATATAIAFAQTTSTAQSIATGTAIAHALASETAHVNATGTAIAYAQATEAAAIAHLKATQAREVEATTTAIALRAQIARVENARLTTTIGWVITFAALLAGLILLMWLGVAAIQAWRKRMSVVTHGPYGNPLLILDGPHGQQVIVDPARLFGPAAVIERDGSVVAPELARTWLQERATQRAQLIALQQANHAPPPTLTPTERRTWRRIGPIEWETENVSNAPAFRPASTHSAEPNYTAAYSGLQRAAETMLSDAPWQVLDDWRGGGLPLGLAHSGLLLADPETSPHLLMAGTSGSGKTRYGLRPLITAALADGWQVLIFDRSGLDFLPFREHPNAVLQLLRHPTDAVGYFSSVYDEMERRFALLREAGASTWGRLSPLPAWHPERREAQSKDVRPGEGLGMRLLPRLLAVFDEFSNLADSLADKEREELWRWARMIAAEGRKAGVHLALALQDPTHKSLDLRIRRNCTPLAFRVKDGEASRVILGAGGAEALAPRQFLTVLGNTVTRAVAFAPDDEQITSFLTRRSAPPHPRPDWLQLPAPVTEERTTIIVEQIRQLRAQGHSLNSIQQQVFGYTGGKAYSVVRAALRDVGALNH
jgi:hypothetical protein